MEEWRDVVGFEGQYQVSSLGTVKSLRRQICKGKRGERIIPERILIPSTSNRGYQRVYVGKLTPVHRIVALAFLPNPDNKAEVNHIDGNKQNNHALNLEWCTRSENERHARAIGLKKTVKGGKHHSSKISDEEREAIGRLYSEGISVTAIGRIKGFHPDYISKVLIKLGVQRRPRAKTFIGERARAYYKNYQQEWQKKNRERLNEKMRKRRQAKKATSANTPK